MMRMPDFQTLSQPSTPTHRTASDSTLALHKYPATFPSALGRLEKLAKSHTDEQIGRFAIDALVYIHFPYPEEYISCNFTAFGHLIRQHLFTKILTFQKTHYPLIAELSIRSQASRSDSAFLSLIYRIAVYAVISDLATTKYSPDLPPKK